MAAAQVVEAELRFDQSRLDATGAAGAVWTDFTSNYRAMRGEAFSVARAYLATLTGDSLDEAVRYIENAPATTMTPLRRALAADDWWRAEVARVKTLDAD